MSQTSFSRVRNKIKNIGGENKSRIYGQVGTKLKKKVQMSGNKRKISVKSEEKVGRCPPFAAPILRARYDCHRSH